VKNEHTRLISGTGLGLSIVRKIVTSYFGQINVESEEGKGSTFSILLPALGEFRGQSV
ncbi:MAG: ATP-binding protein, partial [candidate division NC10 bacterium]|nr:ATP-binding protein [candidate division NC10 bacterium]